MPTLERALNEMEGSGTGSTLGALSVGRRAEPYAARGDAEVL